MSGRLNPFSLLRMPSRTIRSRQVIWLVASAERPFGQSSVAYLLQTLQFPIALSWQSMAAMLPVEVGQASSAESLAAKMMQASDRNGLVIKNFVRDVCETEDLLTWAKEFCSLGDPVKDQLCYYQGHEAKPGESFSQQLQRQLEEDLRNCAEDLDKKSVSAEIAQGSPSAAKALLKLLERLMQVHESCTSAGGRGELCWKIKLEVNQDGACTKFHDDHVTVRFALTLTGDGTVLAHNDKVDWDFYESCQGALPALADGPDLSPEKAREIIQQWNEQVPRRKRVRLCREA